MVTYVADHVACREGLGFSLSCKGEEINPAVLAELSLTPEMLTEIVKALPEALKETEALLS
jgi:hypothetical protein